jgi:alpha-ketoglutarate-dependent taurine dioxygenase
VNASGGVLATAVSESDLVVFVGVMSIHATRGFSRVRPTRLLPPGLAAGNGPLFPPRIYITNHGRCWAGPPGRGIASRNVQQYNPAHQDSHRNNGLLRFQSGSSEHPGGSTPSRGESEVDLEVGFNLSLQQRRTLLTRGELFEPGSDVPLIRPRDLRNGCRCEQCINPSDRQRNYNWADIPTDIQIESHDVDADGIFSIKWLNDVPGFTKHVSRYSKQDVLNAVDFYSRHGQTVHSRPVRPWDKSNYHLENSTIGYDSFMQNPRFLATALHLLSTYGLVFISDVPKDEYSVKKLAERVGPLRNTFYGPTWDVRSVLDAKNVAYTSRNLGLHMDLLYMAEPPGLQLLHCMENTCEGGLSRFVDTFKVLDVLVSECGPEFMHQLSRLRIAYEYSNDGAYYYDSKPVVSYHAWPNLKTKFRGARNPALLSNVQRVYWSPPFAAPHTRWQQEDVPGLQAAKLFADMLEVPGMALTTKFSPGTCAIFDNLRVLHARL